MCRRPDPHFSCWAENPTFKKYGFKGWYTLPGWYVQSMSIKPGEVSGRHNLITRSGLVAGYFWNEGGKGNNAKWRCKIESHSLKYFDKSDYFEQPDIDGADDKPTWTIKYRFNTCTSAMEWFLKHVHRYSFEKRVEENEQARVDAIKDLQETGGGFYSFA